MYTLIPHFLFFILSIYLFFREAKLDHKKYLEADRLGDEHVLKEVERFLKEKEQAEKHF